MVEQARVPLRVRDPPERGCHGIIGSQAKQSRCRKRHFQLDERPGFRGKSDLLDHDFLGSGRHVTRPSRRVSCFRLSSSTLLKQTWLFDSHLCATSSATAKKPPAARGRVRLSCSQLGGLGSPPVTISRCVGHGFLQELALSIRALPLHCHASVKGLDLGLQHVHTCRFGRRR